MMEKGEDLRGVDGRKSGGCLDCSSHDQGGSCRICYDLCSAADNFRGSDGTDLLKVSKLELFIVPHSVKQMGRGEHTVVVV